jgi:chromosome partitioning protein
MAGADGDAVGRARVASELIGSLPPGGADGTEFRSALLAADVLLLPLRPGSFDFWTLVKMDEVVGLAETDNPNLRSLIDLSQVPPSARDRAQREAAQILRDMPRFRLLDTLVIFRAAFGHCAGDGLTVEEAASRDPKACAEMAFLADEVFVA